MDAALARATTEEACNEDGNLVGWRAENPECESGSAFGTAPDEPRDKIRLVLAGWVWLGQELGQHHPFISRRHGSCTCMSRRVSSATRR